MAEAPRCVRCGEPVKVNQEQYEVFERMYWLCFHLTFEHTGDPDEPCTDPGCPWWRIKVYERRLAALGVNPSDVVSQAVQERYLL